MSRISVLSRSATLPRCGSCGNDITHDVVRVDEGSVFHVRCYHKGAGDEDRALFECPKCHTIGRTWHWRRLEWMTCDLCQGSGYLSASPGVSRAC
jgi:predicted RNA-binding Zn-ribbon protein involved in translation (DUF1610 family)